MATVLLTGANRGIGLALAQQLAARGDTVFATARDPDRAEGLNRLAALPGGKVTPLRLDVTDPGALAAVRDRLAGVAINVLINNAGIIGPARQSTLDMDFDGWMETLAVNTLAPLRVVQTFLPNIRAAGGGAILTITSRMGSLTASPGTDRIAYRSSKAALNRAMQAVAGDLRASGIAVVVAHPGWVKTDMGGSGADITPDQSAAGLISVIDHMSATRSPRFVNFDGSDIGW